MNRKLASLVSISLLSLSLKTIASVHASILYEINANKTSLKISGTLNTVDMPLFDSNPAQDATTRSTIYQETEDKIDFYIGPFNTDTNYGETYADFVGGTYSGDLLPSPTTPLTYESGYISIFTAVGVNYFLTVPESYTSGDYLEATASATGDVFGLLSSGDLSGSYLANGVSWANDNAFTWSATTVVPEASISALILGIASSLLIVTRRKRDC